MLPALGVLFDGVAYGMLLFLMSVGLSVTLGMMNFVNLAHCSFAMLGGYVTVTLMNAARLAVPRHAAGGFCRRRGGKHRAGANLLSAFLQFERTQSVPADHRHSLRVDRDCRLHLRHRPAADAVADLSAGLFPRRRRRPRGLSALSDRGGGADHGFAHGDAGIDSLRRASPRRGQQSADGARPWHRRRPAVRLHLCARRRFGGARRRRLPFPCWDSTRHSR